MKKKILYISQCFPLPLDGGGKIKSFNTLKTLSSEYKIFAVFISERQANKEDLALLKKMGIECKVFKAKGMSESIKKNYWRLAWNYLQLRPHFVYQYHFPPAKKFIKEKIKNWQPDIIHVDHINTSQFLPKKRFIKNNLKKPIKIILENHNLDHIMFKTRFFASRKAIRKLYLFLEGSLNYLYGKVNYPRYDLVLSISDQEKKYLNNICKQVVTLPLIYPLKKAKQQQEKKIYDLLFIGHLEWPPNEIALIYFARKILPLVKNKIPDIKLHVIGKRNPRLKKLETNKNIAFHGYQKDINPFLTKSKIFILPFKTGAGVRIKSLTALQNGIPIVSTNLGIEGLKIKDGQEFILANNANDFAQAIIELLNNPALMQKMSQKQISYFSKNHSVRQNYKLITEYKKYVE